MSRRMRFLHYKCVGGAWHRVCCATRRPSLQFHFEQYSKKQVADKHWRVFHSQSHSPTRRVSIKGLRGEWRM